MAEDPTCLYTVSIREIRGNCIEIEGKGTGVVVQSTHVALLFRASSFVGWSISVPDKTCSCNLLLKEWGSPLLVATFRTLNVVELKGS